MYKLKNSLIAFGGLSLLIGAIALVTPTTGQGQGQGGNQPPLNVNVVNTPLPVTGTVTVGNLGDSPLPVRDVDNGQQPFHMTEFLLLSPGNSSVVQFGFTVPAGKRLIIETVSARVTLVPPDTPTQVEVLTRVTDFAFHKILVSQQGLSANFVGTHYVRIYADPGTDVGFLFARSNVTEGAAARVTISGYLVDVP